jgi:hypothetical protein
VGQAKFPLSLGQSPTTCWPPPPLFTRLMPCFIDFRDLEQPGVVCVRGSSHDHCAFAPLDSGGWCQCMANATGHPRRPCAKWPSTCGHCALWRPGGHPARGCHHAQRCLGYVPSTATPAHAHVTPPPPHHHHHLHHYSTLRGAVPPPVPPRTHSPSYNFPHVHVLKSSVHVCPRSTPIPRALPGASQVPCVSQPFQVSRSLESLRAAPAAPPRCARALPLTHSVSSSSTRSTHVNPLFRPSPVHSLVFRAPFPPPPGAPRPSCASPTALRLCVVPAADPLPLIHSASSMLHPQHACKPWSRVSVPPSPLVLRAPMCRPQGGESAAKAEPCVETCRNRGSPAARSPAGHRRGARDLPWYPQLKDYSHQA